MLHRDFRQSNRKTGDSKTLARVVRRDSLLVLPPGATVHEAAQLMCKYGCGAVGVVDGSEKLLGLVTDGDILRKVVTLGRDPHGVAVEQVMTTEIDTIDLSCDANDALGVVSRSGHRYLPVMEDGRLAGILDVRDLYEEVRRVMDRSLAQKDALLHYMFHEPYGLGAQPIVFNQ